MKTIVIINGYPESGKDTFVEFCRDYLCNQLKLGSKEFSSVDNVKIAAEYLGWDRVKNEKGRKFLSDLKDMSTELYDGPFKQIVNFIEKYNHSVFFIYIREPPEIQKLKDWYEGVARVITVFVKSNQAKTSYSNTGDSGVLNFKYDIEIFNNWNDGEDTREELKKTAEVFCLQNFVK
jgi:hypothetical protein